MDRGLFMCVAGRHALSSSAFGCGRVGQDSSSRKSQGEQLFGRSFQLGQSFSNNEVLDYVSGLARNSRPAIVVLPANWTTGGGPRTYPGGMRKWQWKRRRRKDERELEKQRLVRERKIFETRRRQELRKTSTPVSPALDRSVESWNSSEVMLSSSYQGGSLPSLGRILGENAVNESSRGMQVLGKAAEGGQVSENVQGGWTGSRTEVAKQIQKVRDIVSNKYRRRAGSSDSETTSSFSELPLSPSTLKALSFILDIRNMTPLQEAIFPIILQGNRLPYGSSVRAAVQNALRRIDTSPQVARSANACSHFNAFAYLPRDDLLAKTKVAGEDTITSLIYAIELVLTRRQDQPVTGIARMQQNLTVSGRSPITVVVVCATQESAAFVASEAKLLLMFHPGIRVQVVKGGNDFRKETRCLQSLPCQILVATPGRLLNHLQSSPELRGQLSDLRLFVLMEVQKLLDMGYRRTIERISQRLSRSRQTLLWSSSQSDEVLALAENILKKDHEVISSCGSEEDEGSHRMVRHDFLMVPMELHLAMIVSLLNAHVEKEPKYKVVVFCQTVRTTTFMSETFKNLGFLTCELHMRKNEKHRERTAAVFRTMKDGVILFTCGASVWGIANPDVTLILQIGQPAGREQYIRRVTLSGQETKERECILLLMPHEQAFLNELSAVPLWELALPEINSDAEAKVQHAVQQVDSLVRVKAYLAWLRYHVSRATSISDKQEAVKLASIYCIVLGFERPPQLNSRTIATLGLKGILYYTDSPQGGAK